MLSVTFVGKYFLNLNKKLDLRITEELAGGISYDQKKTPLTDDVLYKAMDSDAVLLGAVGGPKYDQLEFSKRPERALLRLRKELRLFANLRPAICFSELVSASSLKPEIVSDLDIMIVRELTERYYGHLAQFNYVGARTFIRHSKQRLPKYEDAYKKYAEQYETDWRLMAAMGYQESHWRPNAVSPTGVRGLMMLTQVTAKEMGIKNRLDPLQSIKGGVKYFARIHKRIPDSVPEPDKTWFALASYNVGLGHLEDARILTEKGGKDPNKWADVKEFLPLLQQKKYYSKTRYGYR